eukprot:Awhi_evm1s4888
MSTMRRRSNNECFHLGKNNSSYAFRSERSERQNLRSCQASLLTSNSKTNKMKRHQRPTWTEDASWKTWDESTPWENFEHHSSSEHKPNHLNSQTQSRRKPQAQVQQPYHYGTISNSPTSSQSYHSNRQVAMRPNSSYRFSSDMDFNEAIHEVLQVILKTIETMNQQCSKALSMIATPKPKHNLKSMRIHENLKLKCKIPYDHQNPIHENGLEDLWTLMLPDKIREGRYTRQWGKLGFQGKDPATDFRGTGAFGLRILHYFCITYTVTAKEVLDRAHRNHFPFACAVINILAALMTMTKEQPVVARICLDSQLCFQLNDVARSKEKVSSPSPEKFHNFKNINCNQKQTKSKIWKEKRTKGNLICFDGEFDDFDTDHSSAECDTSSASSDDSGDDAKLHELIHTRFKATNNTPFDGEVGFLELFCSVFEKFSIFYEDAKPANMLEFNRLCKLFFEKLTLKSGSEENFVKFLAGQSLD